MTLETWKPINPAAIPCRNAAVEKTITDDDMAELRALAWPPSEVGRALPIFLLALRDALGRNVSLRFYAAYNGPKNSRSKVFHEALRTTIAAKIVHKRTNRSGKVTLWFTPKAECFFYQRVWLP
jgi:hypothetical protein